MSTNNKFTLSSNNKINNSAYFHNNYNSNNLNNNPNGYNNNPNRLETVSSYNTKLQILLIFQGLIKASYLIHTL